MSARQQRLAGIAVAAGVICWTLGMTIAVVTENPLDQQSARPARPRHVCYNTSL